jgi:hypothetical protein
MRLELSEYIYEDIPFDIIKYTEYISVATEILSRCSHYIQMHTLYSSEQTLFIQYEEWQTEYDEVCQKHDTSEKESDRLESLLKERESLLHRAILERQSLETKQKQIEQKKTEYDLYCSERSRRFLEYTQNMKMLDASWYTLLHNYHSVVGMLFGILSALTAPESIVGSDVKKVAGIKFLLSNVIRISVKVSSTGTTCPAVTIMLLPM